MSQYDLLHRLQLFRDRGQPPGHHPQPLVGGRGSVRTSGGRTSPLTEAETSRVRRALFGPVDHAENLRFVKQELERGQREAEKRWNYDFVNDRPVNDPDQRYQWESLESSTQRHTPRIASLNSSSDAEERSGINITSANIVSEESFQSENIPSMAQKVNAKSEKSQDFTMSEKKLSSKPNPIIGPPTTKTKSDPQPSSFKVSKPLEALSAPATACGTPHESPHAGSNKTGSQIIPTSKSEAEVCDNPIPADRILTAAASSLASSSKSSKSNISDQRSRSKSLHGTQPITGLFRERKRSKSKTKIDSRSLKLQESIAPSQIAMSNFTVTNEGRNAHIARSRSPTSTKYTPSDDK